jgi:hypothetical protein
LLPTSQVITRSFNDAATGISDDDNWHIHIDASVMPEAHHILTMRGISRTHQSKMRFNTETWLSDETLRGLDGVEIRRMEGN